MKTTLDPQEKIRRQAWRTVAFQSRTTDMNLTRPVHIDKRMRVIERGLQAHRARTETPVVMVDLRERIANLFKGITYRGPYVHVTHKEAFQARVLKRTAKALAEIAMAEANGAVTIE
jgi:hypothetical protein